MLMTGLAYRFTGRALEDSLAVVGRAQSFAAEAS
jgi:hypothetical protein